MTYKTLMKAVCDELVEAGIENAQYETKELLGKTLKIDCRDNKFQFELEKLVDEGLSSKFKAFAQRRKNGEPLQYILGEWEFYGLPFLVGEGVLIPRQDTETLVEHAITKHENSQGITVVDLCAGSGCIGITLEKNLNCEKVICVERSKFALNYLEKNIRLNDSKAQLFKGDVLDESLLADFPLADLIVCNPPYLTDDDMENLQKEVSFEPRMALFGGEDGLDFYRDIVRIWKDKLKDNGNLMFEIGINQEQEVMQILIQHGFKNVRAKRDLCGIYRIVTGTYSKKMS